ncbi:MAG: sterol desaturase family protein [Niabella sp.]|nr:sterol desaturase family protein [Niabella sp.]
MQKYISENGHQLQLLMFIFLFILGWNIENITGVLLNYKKWKHAFSNAPFTLTNIPGQLLLGFALVKTIEWTTKQSFGLVYLLPAHMPPVLKFIVSFMLLDLGEYGYHVVMHKIKKLWMIHAIHHSDEVVDISTTLREHPAENIIRLSFTLVWVLLSGTTFWMFMLRQMIQSVAALFAHMNCRIPDRIDRVIGLVFITPNLHQVHHHYKRPFTDCNYGDVMSIWDRIFGTFRQIEPDQLVFGVDTYMEQTTATNFMGLIKAPFQKRKYTDDENTDR